MEDPLGLKIADAPIAPGVTSPDLKATRARVDATIEHLVAGRALDSQFILGLLNEVSAALQPTEPEKTQ